LREKAACERFVDELRSQQQRAAALSDRLRGRSPQCV
jgi:hypothetical protein